MTEISRREQMIFDIATMEWEMFQAVQNTGGRASCQDNPQTFFRMRMSQWMIFPDEVLESYMADIQTGVANGRNLIFEKYGYMMETSFPEEFEQIKSHLPELSDHKLEMIEEIARQHVIWDQEVYAKYPHVRQNGRAFNTSDDNPMVGSSSESYLKGEYKTFSEQTVSLILDEVRKAVATGDNLLEQIVLNEAKFYGYESLADAEAKQAIIDKLL